MLAANDETVGHPRTPCYRRVYPVGAGRPNSVPIYVLARISPPAAARYRRGRSLDEEERAYMLKAVPAPMRLLMPFLVERTWKKYAATLRTGT